MKVFVHTRDLDPSVSFEGSVAVDTEALGLQVHRDRLCVVQLSQGDGVCHLVHFPAQAGYEAPHLKKVLSDPKLLKIFHFARFDLAVLKAYLGVDCAPFYCTKIASKIARTYTDRHGLKDLCGALLGVEISKDVRASDWGGDSLTDAQKTYAATDVLYLHALKEKLDSLLERENRHQLAHACFQFLPTCVDLDLKGWDPGSLFSH